MLKPGSPCMGKLGYCDTNSRCRRLDAQGPLSRISKIFINDKTKKLFQLLDNVHIFIF